MSHIEKVGEHEPQTTKQLAACQLPRGSTEMDEVIAKLREALAQESDAQAQAEKVALRIDEVRQIIARCLAQRRSMIDQAAAALDDEVPAIQGIAEMDRVIAEAEAKVEVFSRGLELAQGRLAEHGRLVTGVLTAMAEAHERECQTGFDEACAQFNLAIANREAASRSLQSAQRLRGASGDVLRSRFAEALASARAA